MFVAKMRRHFEGVHPDCKDKPSDFFGRKYGELKKAQKIISYHSKTFMGVTAGLLVMTSHNNTHITTFIDV